jgi:hypothetical protein
LAIATDAFTTHDGNQEMDRNIEAKGWHIVCVPETPASPGWAFTVGLHRSHCHPEIVIVGLPIETMEAILEGLASDVTHGAYYDVGASSAGVLEDLTCEFRPVDRLRYDRYLATALRYYGDDEFPAVQCVWPDSNNHLPGERGAEPELAELQPLLHARSGPGHDGAGPSGMTGQRMR